MRRSTLGFLFHWVIMLLYFLFPVFSVLYYSDLNKDFAVIPVFPLCFVSIFLTLLAKKGN